MKKLSILLILFLMSWAAQAGLIDDFSDPATFTNYTHVKLIDAGNTAEWQITGGVPGLLQLNTTVYQGIEQHAFLETASSLTLAVGEEVQADLTHSGASQDIGLYVGGTFPSQGSRGDYINVYARSDGDVFTRGFDGTAEYGLVGDWGNPTFDKLFIARTAANTFEAGWYSGTTRTVLVTRTPTFANDADVLGFYADVRNTGVLGDVDAWYIIPEPATIALLGLGGLLIRKRR